MKNPDAGRGGLQDEPFSFFEGNDGRVRISWRGKQVAVLAGTKAQRFLLRIAHAAPEERQLQLARITGNFKRGNEKKR